MNQIMILFAACCLTACGDSPKKSVNGVPANNSNVNNTSMNNSTNNETNNNGGVVLNNNTSNSSNNANNANNEPMNNVNGIDDSTPVNALTDEQEETLLDEFDGYKTQADRSTVCLIQGYFAALDLLDRQGVGADIQNACDNEQAVCLEAPRDPSIGIYRGENCMATVGELRACEQSRVQQISALASELPTCNELTNELVIVSVDGFADIPDTAECIGYDEVCP